MRTASGFCGGVGGWGSVCGAMSGAVIGLDLLYGTEGNETPEQFQEKRAKLRDLTQEFMKAFQDEWGSVNCKDLLGVDRLTEEGKRLYEEKSARDEFRCSEYVPWAAEKILEIIRDDRGP